MTDTFTEVMNPNDPVYMIRRQEQIDRLLQMNMTQLDRQLRYQMSQPAPRDEGSVGRKVAGEMMNAPFVPDVAKNILGSASGSGLTDGSALIRQDLEPTLYALFVTL